MLKLKKLPDKKDIMLLKEVKRGSHVGFHRQSFDTRSFVLNADARFYSFKYLTHSLAFDQRI